MVEITGDDLKYFSEFQRVTGIHPLDFIDTESAAVVLVENKGELYRCIGKKGANLQKLSIVFRKPVFIFVDSSDIVEFLKNAFPNVSKMNVKTNGDMATLVVLEQDRGYVVGRGGVKIKAIRELLKRRFKIENFQLRTTKEFVDEQ